MAKKQRPFGGEWNQSCTATVFSFSPSLGPTKLDEYQGTIKPQWKDSLFVLAGRRCGNGAVEECQRARSSMDRDGDGEVEDGGALGHGGAAGFWGAGGGGQHLGLELQELPHEAEVGGDDAAPLLDELKRLLQLHPVGAHQVGQADGGWARDASLAVDEHAAPFVPHRVCGEQEKTRKGLNKEGKLPTAVQSPEAWGEVRNVVDLNGFWKAPIHCLSEKIASGQKST